MPFIQRSINVDATSNNPSGHTSLKQLCFNVDFNIASAVMRRCVDVMCPLGSCNWCKLNSFYFCFSCTEGFLGVNYQGYRQINQIDEKFCGKLWPPELTSKDPRMVLTFDTYGATAARFMASYRFLSGMYVTLTDLDPWPRPDWIVWEEWDIYVSA